MIESRDKFDVALVRWHFNGMNSNQAWLWQQDAYSYSFSDAAIFEKHSQKLFYLTMLRRLLSVGKEAVAVFTELKTEFLLMTDSIRSDQSTPHGGIIFSL